MKWFPPLPVLLLAVYAAGFALGRYTAPEKPPGAPIVTQSIPSAPEPQPIQQGTKKIVLKPMELRLYAADGSWVEVQEHQFIETMPGDEFWSNQWRR